MTDEAKKLWKTDEIGEEKAVLETILETEDHPYRRKVLTRLLRRLSGFRDEAQGVEGGDVSETEREREAKMDDRVEKTMGLIKRYAQLYSRYVHPDGPYGPSEELVDRLERAELALFDRIQAAEERVEEYEEWIKKAMDMHIEAARLLPDEHGDIHRDMVDAARETLREGEQGPVNPLSKKRNTGGYLGPDAAHDNRENDR